MTFFLERTRDKAGLHLTYVGAVEQGKRNITLINAEKIADVLGMSLVDCFNDTESNDERL